MKGLAILIWLLWYRPAFGVDAIDFSRIDDQKSVDHALYLADQDGIVTVESLVSSSESAFKDSGGKNLSFGWTKAVYWVKLPVTNTGNESIQKLLEISWPLLDSIKIFIYDGRELVEQFNLGDKLPFNSRLIHATSFVVPIIVPSGSQHDIYLQVSSTSSVQIPMTLWDPIYYYEVASRFIAAQAFYYGAMVVMMGYNFFIFLASRKLAYFIYVCFVASYVILQSSLKGISFQYVWPNNTSLSDYAISFGGSVAVLFVLLFAYVFLRIDQSSFDKLRKVLKFEIGIGLVFITFCAVAPYSLAIKPLAGFTVVAILTALVAGVIQFSNGLKQARYYILAWLALITGTTTFLLKQFGVLPLNFFTEYAMQIGSFLEVLLLSFALADQLNVMREKLQVANRGLEKLVASIQTQVDQKTQEIRTILNTIQQGIFMIMPGENCIHGDYSAHSEVILGARDLSGKDVFEIFLSHTELAEEELDQIRTVLSLTIGEPQLAFEMNSHLLPNEVIYHQRDLTLSLELDWQPVVDDDDDQIEKILVSIRDITDLKRLKDESHKNEQELMIVSEILDVKREKFLSFWRYLSEVLDDLEIFEHRDDITQGDLDHLRRSMHTVKGNARQLCLVHLSHAIHEFEESLNDDVRTVGRNIKPAADRLMAVCTVYRKVACDKLAIIGDDNRTQKIPYQIARIWLLEIDRWGLHESGNLKSLLKDVKQKSLEAAYSTFAEYIRDLAKGTEKLAADLGKVAPSFLINGDAYFLSDEGQRFLDRVMIHLIRNSLDHGIESPQERISRGKVEGGTISVKISPSDRGYEIVYRDDGRGLNIPTLRNICETTPGSLLALCSVIFRPGLTTASTVTLVSGRGVGLDAVKLETESFGGRIEIELDHHDLSKEFVSFQFRLYLPTHLIKENQNLVAA
ncbi:7TM diverse intracellular signaling domain-containing protein [Pseudobacteriovorax antillogorgiicola]|uniref:Hpt domain-containing protein n=1 Tax=Pseudobacteriovorax antillogorgiicola TaxID=1513793 RepID=A0A1Y6CUN9_9BACT|nr:7TM diverse intracellular signaling domain-containing protein [Pseudobacteriovorax antillogorgiicola]TCS44619.1 Hpt domain-containing protein [Pseudobacteriovorax antillogorgiicola]SMF78343.1 Hpt domain-containing protein [Pseudobacteriovorax antillogorgiicola]